MLCAYNGAVHPSCSRDDPLVPREEYGPPAHQNPTGAAAGPGNKTPSGGGDVVIALQPTQVPQPGVPVNESKPDNEIEAIEVPRAEAVTEIAQVGDMINGVATVKYKDGGIYEGNWDNRRQGTGKMTWKNGNVYQGDWKDDLQDGRGIMTYWDGGRYNGEWKMGQRHGKGEMSWLDGEPYGGTHYQGEWRNDKREGKGLLRDKYEGTYEGDWKDDRAEGFGKATWRNGKWYQGGIYDGKPEGRGTYYHATTRRTIPGNFCWTVESTEVMFVCV